MQDFVFVIILTIKSFAKKDDFVKGLLIKTFWCVAEKVQQLQDKHNKLWMTLTSLLLLFENPALEVLCNVNMTWLIVKR